MHDLLLIIIFLYLILSLGAAHQFTLDTNRRFKSSYVVVLFWGGAAEISVMSSVEAKILTDRIVTQWGTMCDAAHKKPDKHPRTAQQRSNQ